MPPPIATEQVSEQLDNVRTEVSLVDDDEEPLGAHPFLGRIPTTRPVDPPITGPHDSYGSWGY